MAVLSDAIQRGTLAARPAASIAGRLYFVTDTNTLYRDSGTAWESVEASGLAPAAHAASHHSGGSDALALGSIAGTLVEAQTPLTTKGDVLVSDGTLLARVPVGADNQVLTADAAQALGVKWATSTAAAALVKLAEVVVAAGGAADITFSSISGTYRGLMVDHALRGDGAAAGYNLRAQVNADTTAVYDYQILQGSNTAVSASTGVGQTSWLIGALPAAGATAGIATAGRLVLPDYARTVWHKAGLSNVSYKTDHAATVLFTFQISVWWRSTVAITSIKFYSETGNLAEGSVATLYGLTT